MKQKTVSVSHHAVSQAIDRGYPKGFFKKNGKLISMSVEQKQELREQVRQLLIDSALEEIHAEAHNPTPDLGGGPYCYLAVLYPYPGGLMANTLYLVIEKNEKDAQDYIVLTALDEATYEERKKYAAKIREENAKMRDVEGSLYAKAILDNPDTLLVVYRNGKSHSKIVRKGEVESFISQLLNKGIHRDKIKILGEKRVAGEESN